MTDTLAFLKTLISVPGLSGYESPVRDLIEAAWCPLTDEFHLSRLGSLHALRRGTAPEPRPSLMITTHMDAIGLMVSGVEGEFLRVIDIGGLDPRLLPGQLVTIHGRKDLPGVIVQPPAHLLPEQPSGNRFTLDNLLVDLGLPSKDVDQNVRIGDLVSFAQPPIELGEDFLAGHSLDNRASVAALTYCLEELQHRQLQWDLWAVASTLEEESLGGAMTSSFQLHPSLAVAVDATFGAAPGSPDHLTFPLGEGPTLCWGPNIHPGLHTAIKELAVQLEIPHKLEPIATHSGTEAMALQTSADGIPTMLLEIPLRYMHSPVEMVSIKDIQRTGRLLAEFTAGLNGSFLDELSLDD
jgi:putative aminopeptidase FrvX